MAGNLTMKKLLILIPLTASALFGTAGDIEFRERDSSNRTVINPIADPAGDRILVIDDSNASGAKVEGAAIGSGLSFDGTTLSATAASRATTDLAGGTSLAANTDYFDTFGADRTNLAVWGSPVDGQYSTITFDVTGATRSIGFNSTAVYRLGESGSSTGPWSFPVGNHKITLSRMDGKWVLIDSAVDSESANTFLAAPDGAPGAMTPRAIVDGDIPAAIARDSELPTRATLGLATTDKPTFANVVVTHSTHTYAATITVDFTGDGFKTLTITGDPTFATSNRAAGRSVTYRLDPGAAARTPTWAAGWNWVGAAAPTTLTANKEGVLTLTCFGTADTDVFAAYAEEP